MVDVVVEGLVDLFEGATKLNGGGRSVAGVEEGAEESVAQLGVEHSSADSLGCGPVGVGAGDLLDEAVES